MTQLFYVMKVTVANIVFPPARTNNRG